MKSQRHGAAHRTAPAPRLSSTLSGGPSISGGNGMEANRGLRSSARRRDAARVAEENLALLRRIQRVTPVLSRERWFRDAAANQALVARISEFRTDPPLPALPLASTTTTSLERVDGHARTSRRMPGLASTAEVGDAGVTATENVALVKPRTAAEILADWAAASAARRKRADEATAAAASLGVSESLSGVLQNGAGFLSVQPLGVGETSTDGLGSMSVSMSGGISGLFSRSREFLAMLSAGSRLTPQPAGPAAAAAQLTVAGNGSVQ